MLAVAAHPQPQHSQLIGCTLSGKCGSKVLFAKWQTRRKKEQQQPRFVQGSTVQTSTVQTSTTPGDDIDKPCSVEERVMYVTQPCSNFRDWLSKDSKLLCLAPSLPNYLISPCHSLPMRRRKEIVYRENMGLLTILRKVKAKEKEIRILILVSDRQVFLWPFVSEFEYQTNFPSFISNY